MSVNVIDQNDNGGTQFLIGGLIGYADALYTPYDADGNWVGSDYRGDGSVTIENCKVGMTVNKDGAEGVSVGSFLGGIGKSVTSKTGTEYSVTANIDDASTFPEVLDRIGKELTLNYSTASESLPAGTAEDKRLRQLTAQQER